MESRHYQAILFEKIREAIPPSESLIDHLMETLSLSRDSGYRRLRNETSLTFDEAVKICNRYKISLNAISGQNEVSAVFTRLPSISCYEDYLTHNRHSLEMLKKIKSFKNHKMIYSAKDIPVFYQFAFPCLAAFKMYVWMKSVYDIKMLNGRNYSMEDLPEELLSLAKEQWKVFSQINTIEIWNDTTVSSLLNQISYYFEAGLLSGKEAALEICADFEEMMKVIYKQALTGEKVHANNPEVKSGAGCDLYYHEILIMNNHILADLDEQRSLYFIPMSGVNYIHTSDDKILDNARNYLHSQTKKSALISDVSEKERNRFFLKIKNRIDHLKERISSTELYA